MNTNNKTILYPVHEEPKIIQKTIPVSVHFGWVSHFCIRALIRYQGLRFIDLEPIIFKVFFKKT